MDTQSIPILPESETPENSAAPFETECDPPGAHSLRGGSPGSPLPSSDASESLALEQWAAQRDAELYQIGPDGTYSYRDQADRFFE